MKEVKITCDKCNSDITTTGNSIDYRIVLKSESIPSWGSAVTDMMIYPQVGEHYFCSRNCLRDWVKENIL